MVCPGNAMSAYHEELLLFKNVTTVNKNLGFDDICKEKYVNVAYNNEPTVFEAVLSVFEKASNTEYIWFLKMIKYEYWIVLFVPNYLNSPKSIRKPENE